MPPVVLVLAGPGEEGLGVPECSDVFFMARAFPIEAGALFKSFNPHGAPYGLFSDGLRALVGRVDAVFLNASSRHVAVGRVAEYWGAACDEARHRKVPVFTSLEDLTAWVKLRARRLAEVVRRLEAEEGASVSSEDAAHRAKAHRAQLLDHARDVAADFKS